MRLIKLAAMVLAGYAVYELVRLCQPKGESRSRQAESSPAQKADNRRARLSGESGKGMRVQVADTNGGTRRQIAGRGVIPS